MIGLKNHLHIQRCRKRNNGPRTAHKYDLKNVLLHRWIDKANSHFTDKRLKAVMRARRWTFKFIW